jgi:hypothetical protein
MWRGILRYGGEIALLVVLLYFLEWMNAMPDRRFTPLIIGSSGCHITSSIVFFGRGP